MSESRSENTKKNIITSYLFTIVSIIFNFASRFFITRVFGKEYLGLSSLFVSVLQVLSIAEMGFASAMVYNMYKPIAERDTSKVCALLNYYKKIYRKIGLVVLSVGTILLPFIPGLIKGSVPKDINIYVLYYLYLVNSAVSYFLFAYKTSLLEALQKNSIVSIVYCSVTVFRYFLQITAILLFKNYYLFVLLLILGTALNNIISAIVAKKKYPEYLCKGKLTKEDRKDISVRIKGLLVSLISGKTYSTFDSIIISAYLGLRSVAVYNNYYLIYSSILLVLGNIRTSMQASVGNSVAVESTEKNYNDMLLFQFLFSSISLVCVSCMFTLYQPFMIFWMGTDMLLPLVGVVLFCAWFVVSCTNYVYLLYCTADGLWWEMRYSYFFSAIFNIVMNLLLGKIWGVNGIVFSSLLANVIFGLFWQCRILFKCYFKTGYKRYIVRQLHYYFLCALSCFVSYNVCKIINSNNIFGLFLYGCLTIAVSLTVLFFGTFKMRIFKNGVVFIKKLIKR